MDEYVGEFLSNWTITYVLTVVIKVGRIASAKPKRKFNKTNSQHGERGNVNLYGSLGAFSPHCVLGANPLCGGGAISLKLTNFEETIGEFQIRMSNILVL